MGKTPPGQSGTGRRRGRSLTTGEVELWRQAMRDTEPLPGRVLPEPPQEPAPAPDPIPTPPPRGLAPLPQPGPVARPPLPFLGVGESPNVDKRTAEKLRKGGMDIEGRLDLHGMTQDQAHGALTSFITRSQDAGKRCVLVITGKGYRDGQIGILRASVPRWFNSPPLRERILSFTHAQARDGGEGALYVLLKRKR